MLNEMITKHPISLLAYLLAAVDLGRAGDLYSDQEISQLFFVAADMKDAAEKKADELHRAAASAAIFGKRMNRKWSDNVAVHDFIAKREAELMKCQMADRAISLIDKIIMARHGNAPR